MAKPVYISEVENIYRGDDWSLVIEWFDDDGFSTPKDVSGATFRAQIRKSVSSKLTAECAISFVDNFTIKLSLSSAETEELKPGDYIMDLEQTNGLVVTPLRWEHVLVTADVTRD